MSEVADVVAGRLAQADAQVAAVSTAVRRAVTPKEALELVNEIRGAIGVEPLDDLPPGRQGDPNACVLANALSVNGVEASVGGTITLSGLPDDTRWNLVVLGLAESDDGEAVTIHQDVVGRFVSAFDGGELERYIENGE